MVPTARVYPELQTEHWFHDVPVQVEQAPLHASQVPCGEPFLYFPDEHVKQAFAAAPLQVRQLGSHETQEPVGGVSMNLRAGQLIH